MNTKININPMDWYCQKLLPVIPEHFIKCNLTSDIDRRELLQWIKFNTSGRVGISGNISAKSSWLIDKKYYIGFENPEDATIYTMRFA
jgi:hypothetical protein